MKPITTYEDIADSEEEFLMQRDKVMLDDGPDAKRRRKHAEEDALLEPSDEEVLGYSSEDEDEDDNMTPRGPSRAAPSDEEADEEEEEGWGTSKKDYYNADEIQTEADALEEEAEARRIQKKRLQKMTAADFGFDEIEWIGAEKANGKEEDEEERDVVVEVLKDIEVTHDTSREERLRLLNIRYPEFNFLAEEILELQPVLEGLQKQMEDNASQIITVKVRTLAAYIASLAMYFTLLSSPTQNSSSETQPLAMDPSELHNHPIMDSLLSCRNLWIKVKSLKERTPALPTPSKSASDSEPEPLTTTAQPTKSPPPTKKAQKEQRAALTAAETAKQQVKRLKSTEVDLAELDFLLPSHKSKSKSSKSTEPLLDDNSDSDFGEETHLTHRDASKKAARKKSLKFYTSQITQKANKRVGAGRDAGGDEDLPYRERLKDRQARLNAEAEMRGKKLDEAGRGSGGRKDKDIELGNDSNGDEDEVGHGAKGEDGEDDEYYNLITSAVSKKKAAKVAAAAATQSAAQASALDRVAGDADLDEDEKRAIGYTIQKNKGLTPHRKKDVRNPRVKKRKKYEEKKKKLGSMKAVYKGGEERGGYGGEKTGIKAGLVKSIKL
ncbi:Sas10 C-terminal domain-containing protein [Tricladium varicosporioides]|nr:Sas10 C-terminal domain-containing protein [Hymenoscyphus varicosporioides]